MIEASSRAARHPGLRRDDERWLRQLLPAELAQCRAPIGLEAGDVRTRRGDAERERLPPVLERGVLDVHRDGALDDVADSSRAKEVGQVAGPAAGADRPSLRSEEHTSELQSLRHLVCRLLLEKKKTNKYEFTLSD